MKVQSRVLMLPVIVIGAVSLSLFAREYNSDSSDHSINPKTKYNAKSLDARGDGLTSFGVHRTAQIEATVNCNGTAGLGFHPGTVPADTEVPDVSFASPPGSQVEYLYGMALWIGGIVGTDTLVSVGADGWSSGSEVFPPGWPQEGSVAEIDYIADHSLIAHSVDTFTNGIAQDYFGRPHIPMNLDIVLASHSWDQPGLDEIIVYDLGLTNLGSDTIHDAHVGIYVDADVCFDCGGTAGYTDDIAGSIPEHQIGYIIDNDGDFFSWTQQPTPRIFALKWLHSSFEAADTSFNWWASNGQPALDFGPRLKGSPSDPFRDFGTGGLGTPEGDVNKYYLLSHAEWDYDQIQTASIPPTDPNWLYPNQDIAGDISDGFDARFLLSMGPFDLPPGATERVMFAAFTADSVHVDSTNTDNLPNDPDTYLANLNFENVLSNALVADSLGQLVMNTLYPVSGLRVSAQTDSTVTVRWQRSPFQNIDGYNIYLSDVPPELLPYPGIPAPWLEPDELVLAAVVPPAQLEYTFEGLDPSAIYFVNVASVTDGVVGNPGSPIFIRSGSSATQSPLISAEYLFIQESEPATIEWSAPMGVAVDHYHLYRGDSAWAAIRYHPFYDEGQAADSIAPVDSFYITEMDRTYYYYAMETFTEVDASTTNFLDLGPNDNDVYFVSAVDEFGFETPFSDQMQLHFVEPRTKDILVIKGRSYPVSGVSQAALREFYDSLLFGYDHDFYSVGDSTHLDNCGDGYPQCVDWHDFMRYKVVVVDGGFNDNALTAEYEDQMKGYTRYLLSGGTLVAFGPLMRLNGYGSSVGPGIYATDHWFIQRFLGIDSVAFMFWGYCPTSIDCHQYTGFQWAESVDGSMPDIVYDPVNAPFSSVVDMVWPCGQCAPDVASFKVNEDAVVTHLAHTLYPSTSMLEGEPIGLTVENEGTKVWRFGFHLWYMEPSAARQLIEAILPPSVRTTIEPDTVYAFWANSTDPQPLNVYLGQFPEGFAATDVDAASLMVNSTVTPTSWSVLPSHPDYVGEVLQLEVSVVEFLDSYGLIWGMGQRTYTVSGQYVGSDSLTAVGTVVLGGHIPGDLNGDGTLDISDLIALVEYMFQQGSAPAFPMAADVDANCTLDIGDLIYLVDYFFTGGEAPQPGCVNN